MRSGILNVYLPNTQTTYNFWSIDTCFGESKICKSIKNCVHRHLRKTSIETNDVSYALITSKHFYTYMYKSWLSIWRRKNLVHKNSTLETFITFIVFYLHHSFLHLFFVIYSDEFKRWVKLSEIDDYGNYIVTCAFAV